MSDGQPRDDWITGWVDAIEWLDEYKGEVGSELAKEMRTRLDNDYEVEIEQDGTLVLSGAAHQLIVSYLGASRWPLSVGIHDFGDHAKALLMQKDIDALAEYFARWATPKDMPNPCDCQAGKKGPKWHTKGAEDCWWEGTC